MRHTVVGVLGTVGRFGVLTVVAGACAVTLAISGCGSGAGGAAQEPTPTATETPTLAPTPTATPTPTPTPSTSTGRASPSPSEPAMVDIADIEEALYADIASISLLSPNNSYPGMLECGSGSVAVGSALKCEYLPDQSMEFGNPYVIVIDADHIQWAKPVCCGGGPSPEDYPSGAYCRDLAVPPLSYTPWGPNPDGSIPQPGIDYLVYRLSYGLAVWYWYAEGHPDRMDADLDGIPCETVYDAGDIAAFWGSTIPLD